MIVDQAAIERETKMVLDWKSSGAVVRQVASLLMKTLRIPIRSTKHAYVKYAMLYVITLLGILWFEFASHLKMHLMISVLKTSKISCRVASQKYVFSGTSQDLSIDTTYALVKTTQHTKIANSRRLKIKATIVITT